MECRILNLNSMPLFLFFFFKLIYKNLSTDRKQTKDENFSPLSESFKIQTSQSRLLNSLKLIQSRNNFFYLIMQKETNFQLKKA